MLIVRQSVPVQTLKQLIEYAESRIRADAEKPEKFKFFIKDEMERWRKVFKEEHQR